MFKFNNTHIFTGYLKQLLSSISIPACAVYTNEFDKYLAEHGHEDPRIIESTEIQVNYLKNNSLYSYHGDDLGWKAVSNVHFDKDHEFHSLSRRLNSRGSSYDNTTHEYLGDYLRFIRDYYDINLMPLYNCFNNKIYNNIYQKQLIKTEVNNPNYDSNEAESSTNSKKITKSEYTIFDSQDPHYKIYAFPVKLFSNYTVAIDCSQGIEMFCGLYKTTLDAVSVISGTDEISLLMKTYKKENNTIFNQPFLYNCLDISKWKYLDGSGKFLNDACRDICYKIINREQDLKLFIKVPNSCKSSITVLEGDYRQYNKSKYAPASANVVLPKEKRIIGQDIHVPLAERKVGDWVYQQNQSIINSKHLNNDFEPITKLQLLALNTGESYPFSTRLVEYLVGSAITPIDELPDNIKRVQKVMNHNKNYFKVDGSWEDKMRTIIYDHIMSAGPIEVVNICIDENDKNYKQEVPLSYDGKTKKMLLDRRRGYQRTLGHTRKSTMFDTLGYVDRDAEKWYTSWTLPNSDKQNNKNDAKLVDNIHSVDIYKGLYDI